MKVETQFLKEELEIQEIYLESLKNKFPENITTLDRVGYNVFLLKHHLNSRECNEKET